MRRFNHARKLWIGAIIAGGLAAIVSAGLVTGCAGKEAVAAAPSAAPAYPYDREASLQSFEVVWNTVNDKHWDPKHGGVDWDAVHAEFRPKIEAATSKAEARGVMEEMLGRLGQSHFEIWPEEIYSKDAAPAAGTGARAEQKVQGAGAPDVGAAPIGSKPEEVAETPGNGNGVSGMDVRVVGNEALVTRVRPGSAADRAGIKPGFLLRSANGQSVEKLETRLEGKNLPPLPRDTVMTMLLEHLLAGDVGEKLELEVEDGGGSVAKKELTLEETTGTKTTLGNMPVFYMTIDRRLLPENVEYFGFSMFMDPPWLMSEYQKSIEEAKRADGLIIDVRGNPGGIGALAMSICGWLVEDEDIRLGTMTTRDGTLNFMVNPRLHPYLGPVAILIDGSSGSTSEIFAGGMKDIGRARIFGERSAGAALPSVFDTLPNGDRFQYAIANYVSVGGEPLEGEGVTPDEEVKPDRAILLAGRDPVIDAAIRWIRSEKAKGAATDVGRSGTTKTTGGGGE